MITIANSAIALSCHEDASGLVLEDRQRSKRWQLDYASLIYELEPFHRREPIPSIAGALIPLRAAMADGGIAIHFRAGNDEVRYLYRLSASAVEVTLPADGLAAVRGISLPGQFLPQAGAPHYLLPIMQGMLWKGAGPSFRWQLADGGHGGFAMPFVGYLGENAGLLIETVTRDDATLAVSKSADRNEAQFVQVSSLGAMRYDRVARIVPTDGTITAVAKAYRGAVMASGRFKSWEEKLAERPALERLFGSLMCFIGYCQDDLDYAAELGKLKAYGFDRALVYPVRFDNYHQPLVMGGRDPIALSPDSVARIKALGYDVAPWSWLNEAMDDGTSQIDRMFRRDSAHNTRTSWSIDEQQWKAVCSSFMAPYKRAENAATMADMSWDHFDVVTCAANDECYALDHPGHLGRPLSRGEDRANLQALLRAGQNGSRAVSSESFNDAYAADYDLGSVKAFPMFRHWPFWPVPLTGLIYHDSMIHSHWEVHNYNFAAFTRLGTEGMFEYGGGRPRLQAALDALMGTPPDVFPFGAQYQWTGRGAETSLTKFRFEDPEVQFSLRLALPVARLHRDIGRLEMVDFAILSADGNVQRSTFADGTAVVANFGSDLRRDVEGVGSLPGGSWVRLG
jgi:hypothetical protein